MKKALKRTLCALLTLVLMYGLVACGGTEAVDPKTCTYDEMVEYLTAQGYISKDAVPVDMLTTAGYVTDNTGGEMPFVPFADKAWDYGGLWLMWWDSGASSEAYVNCFKNIGINNGTIVYMGGAAVLETAVYSGNFAIAFGEGYDQEEAVTAYFRELSQK